MKAGYDKTQIAKLLDRHKSTISRELSHSTGSRGYRPKQACDMSTHRSQNSRNACTLALWVKDGPMSCCACNGVPSKLPLSCPSATKPFIRMFMGIRLRGNTLKESALSEAKEEVLCGRTGPPSANPQQTTFERATLAYLS